MNQEDKMVEEMWEKGCITIPIYHDEINIDEDSIREEFEYKLDLLLKGGIQ